MLSQLFRTTSSESHRMSELVFEYYRKAKLAESQLLVAALRRDAGEIDNEQLAMSATQYAAAVSNWRLARETQLDQITERN